MFDRSASITVRNSLGDGIFNGARDGPLGRKGRTVSFVPNVRVFSPTVWLERRRSHDDLDDNMRVEENTLCMLRRSRTISILCIFVVRHPSSFLLFLFR